MVKISLEAKLGMPEEPIRVGHFFNANFCRYGFFLRYINGLDINELPLIGWYGRLPFVRQKIWGNKKKMDHEQECLFLRDRSLRFGTPEEFAARAANRWQWNYVYNSFTVNGRQLAWRNFQQRKNSLEHIRAACQNYFQSLIDANYLDRLEQDREPPILQHAFRYGFTFKGIRFSTTYGEIWKKRIIRKQKIKTSISKKEVAESVELTMQAIGYYIASTNYSDRILFGIDEEFAETQANGFDLTQDITIQVHELVSGQIFPTSRGPESISDLMFAVESLLEMVEKQDFEPNRENCYMCQYNVESQDGFIPCDKRKRKYGPHRVS